MIESPTSERPLLVGILVDVSGSMTSSIKNVAGPSQNRLQSFQSALGDLAAKAKEISGQSQEERVHLFAYGFGFGNLLGTFFSSASSPPVRDLLEGAKRSSDSSTIGINDLAEDWDLYKAHVESLAIKMFGATPMLEGVNAAAKRISNEKRRLNPSGVVLFILSDGEPTDSEPSDIIRAIEQFRTDDTVIVSCYVTDHDITSPRVLYGKPQSGWPTGADLMFNVASEVPHNTPFHHYLKEHQWNVEIGSRLFTQVNQSEVLAEFLQVIISPLHESARQASSNVFMSYSHKDERWRDRLQVHLKPLVREGAIDLWDDTRIQAGQNWKNEIDLALSKASVAVLLVSADFLASDFIAAEELPTLLEGAQNRGVHILPVIISPSRFSESKIGGFQAVNPTDKPLSKLRKQEAEEFLVALSRDIEQKLG